MKVLSILVVLVAISYAKSLQVDELEPRVFNVDPEQPGTYVDYFDQERPLRIQTRSDASSSNDRINWNKKNNDISRLAMRILKKRGVFRHPIPMMFNL